MNDHRDRDPYQAQRGAVFDFQARCHSALFSSVIPSLYLKFANVEEPVKTERSDLDGVGDKCLQ